jgi:hypothetical protein
MNANRANARASTGPKTQQGKLRAAQNARRHGLSLTVLADPARSAEVNLLAREIAGENAPRDVFGYAQRVAESQIDLIRIRSSRHNLLVCHHCEFTHNIATLKKKTKAWMDYMVENDLRILFDETKCSSIRAMSLRQLQ